MVFVGCGFRGVESELKGGKRCSLTMESWKGLYNEQVLDAVIAFMAGAGTQEEADERWKTEDLGTG